MTLRYLYDQRVRFRFDEFNLLSALVKRYAEQAVVGELGTCAGSWSLDCQMKCHLGSDAYKPKSPAAKSYVRWSTQLSVIGDTRQPSSKSHLGHHPRHSGTLLPGRPLSRRNITTGKVSGVAVFRKEPVMYFLKPGEITRSEIENMGILRNYTVGDTFHKTPSTR